MEWFSYALCRVVFFTAVRAGISRGNERPAAFNTSASEAVLELVHNLANADIPQDAIAPGIRMELSVREVFPNIELIVRVARREFVYKVASIDGFVISLRKVMLEAGE